MVFNEAQLDPLTFQLPYGGQLILTGFTLTVKPFTKVQLC